MREVDLENVERGMPESKLKYQVQSTKFRVQRNYFVNYI